MRERNIFEKHPMGSIPAVPSTPGSFAQANPFSGPLIPLEALIPGSQIGMVQLSPVFDIKTDM